MGAEELDSRLERAWKRARSSGAVSEPTARIRSHAAGFVLSTWESDPPAWLVDLGSGAGVPGLVLAELLPSTRVTLVDANERRCELARAAVDAMGLDERVSVLRVRAADLARSEECRERADAVVARLFGRPAELAECAIPLLVVGGSLVVSVNAETRGWWESVELAGLGAAHEASWVAPVGGFVEVRKVESTSARYPRRDAARRRDPEGWRNNTAP